MELGKAVELCHDKVSDLTKMIENQSVSFALNEALYETKIENLFRENSHLKAKLKKLEI